MPKLVRTPRQIEAVILESEDEYWSGTFTINREDIQFEGTWEADIDKIRFQSPKNKVIERSWSKKFAGDVLANVRYIIGAHLYNEVLK